MRPRRSSGASCRHLAQWEAGAGSIRWVERLTQMRKADKSATGGYSNRYIARARDVLPLIGQPLASLVFR